MTVKLFEIRDSGTFIPAMAIKLSPQNEAEKYLLSKSGYGEYAEDHERYVLFCGLDGGKITYDQYDWGNRTRQVAHDYIIKNFDDLENGAVVDVQFILGETKHIKKSEAIF